MITVRRSTHNDGNNAVIITWDATVISTLADSFACFRTSSLRCCCWCIGRFVERIRVVVECGHCGVGANGVFTRSSIHPASWKFYGN